jgi:Fic family protein
VFFIRELHQAITRHQVTYEARNHLGQILMERLVRLYADTSALHPIVTAAWLHHRFIQIHQFQDGNGRVARALVLLILLRNDHAPLVVDRRRRDEYLSALRRGQRRRSGSAGQAVRWCGDHRAAE